MANTQSNRLLTAGDKLFFFIGFNETESENTISSVSTALRIGMKAKS